MSPHIIFTLTCHWSHSWAACSVICVRDTHGCCWNRSCLWMSRWRQRLQHWGVMKHACQKLTYFISSNHYQSPVPSRLENLAVLAISTRGSHVTVRVQCLLFCINCNWLPQVPQTCVHRHRPSTCFISPKLNCSSCVSKQVSNTLHKLQFDIFTKSNLLHICSETYIASSGDIINKYLMLSVASSFAFQQYTHNFISIVFPLWVIILLVNQKVGIKII